MDKHVKDFLQTIEASVNAEGSAWKAIASYFGNVSAAGVFEDRVKLLYSEITLGCAELKVSRDAATLKARQEVSAFGVLFRVPKTAADLMLSGNVKPTDHLATWRDTLNTLPSEQSIAVGGAKSKGRRYMNAAKKAATAILNDRFGKALEPVSPEADTEGGALSSPEGLALHDAYEAGCRDALRRFAEHISGISQSSAIKQLLEDSEWLGGFVRKVSTKEETEVVAA